jgi:hypothetical protein
MASESVERVRHSTPSSRDQFNQNVKSCIEHFQEINDGRIPILNFIAHINTLWSPYYLWIRTWDISSRFIIFYHHHFWDISSPYFGLSFLSSLSSRSRVPESLLMVWCEHVRVSGLYLGTTVEFIPFALKFLNHLGTDAVSVVSCQLLCFPQRCWQCFPIRNVEPFYSVNHRN